MFRSGYISRRILFFMFVIMSWQISVNKAHAKPVYLSTGESYILNTNNEIDTVFVSSAATADYEVIGNNSVII